MKIALIGFLFFVCSCFNIAQAGLIKFQGYTLDEEKNIVSGYGMDWLQWDETLGLSVDEGIREYSVKGWRLASNIEMAALFNQFFIMRRFIWDEKESTNQRIYNSFDTLEDVKLDNEKQFVTLFGNTYKDFDGSIGSRDPLEFSAAFFGNDLNNDTLYNHAAVWDDYIQGSGNLSYGGYTELMGDSNMSSEKVENMGVALVRDSIEVPEPSTLAIFALGMIGLATRRFKKQ